MAVYTGLVVVLVIVLILLTFASNLRGKYHDIFAVYADVAASRLDAQPSIGPWALALSAEHPWLAQLAVPNPITQNGANFLIRMIRLRRDFIEDNPQCLYRACDDLQAAGMRGVTDSASYFLAGCGPAVQKNADGSDPCRWDDPDNILGTGGAAPAPGKSYFGIARESLLVGDAGASTGRLLALPTLYKNGLEAYVRGSDAAGESVFADYDHLFQLKSVKPPPVAKPPACDASPEQILGGAMSMGGLGAMVGGPVGMLVGGVLGALTTTVIKKASC